MSQFAVEVDEIKSGIFELVQRPFMPRLRAEDKLVAFQRLTRDVLFLGVATVTEATSTTETIDDGTQVLRWTISVSSMKSFDTARSLNTYAGSLEKVRRFLTPDRHFRRRIVKLSPTDFETIANGRLYVARSIFRFLFSSLPLAVQAEFVRLHIDDFPLDANGTIASYLLLAKMLVEFYGNEVLPPLRMMSVIARLHGPRAPGDGPTLETLRLVSGENTPNGRGENIRFGEACRTAAVLTSENQLFLDRRETPVGGRESLLAECARQLAGVDYEEPRWNDPIF